MHDKDITPFKNGERHGHWVKYWGDGCFNYRESYINGKTFGYSEAHYYIGKKLSHIEKDYYAR